MTDVRAFSIVRADGSTTDHRTYSAALDAARTEWPGCEIGHSGDLADGGDRTLIWRSAAEAENDPGVNAIAEIVSIPAWWTP